jgi:hypothetical protein
VGTGTRAQPLPTDGATRAKGVVGRDRTRVVGRRGGQRVKGPRVVGRLDRRCEEEGEPASRGITTEGELTYRGRGRREARASGVAPGSAAWRRDARAHEESGARARGNGRRGLTMSGNGADGRLEERARINRQKSRWRKARGAPRGLAFTRTPIIWTYVCSRLR